MSTYSFTGNKVSFTYQRLLQISDGGDGNPTGIIYDGYGATVTIADENINNLYTTVNNLINNGLAGSTGATGSQGWQGPIGLTGESVTGAQGVYGPTGFQGNTGPQGYQGITGPQGDYGPQGLKGLSSWTYQVLQGSVDETDGKIITASSNAPITIRSIQSYPLGAYVSFEPATITSTSFVYLYSGSYFGWKFESNGNVSVTLNNVETSQGSWSSGQLYSIIYDGNTLKFIKNGIVVQTDNTQTLDPTNLQLEIDFGTLNDSFAEVVFGPVNSGSTGPQGFQGSGGGSTGPQGNTGPQGFQGSGGGSTGPQGNTGPQGFQGIVGPTGSSISPYKYVTSTYSITSDDYYVEAIGTFTINLPTAIGATGKGYLIKSSGTGVITIGTTASQLIDNLPSYNLSFYDTLNIVSNGSNWNVQQPQTKTFTRVYNNTGSIIPKGKALKIQSTYNGIPSVTLPISSGTGSQQVIGLAYIDIPIASEGIAISSGILSGLNLASYSVGDILYLSDTVPGGFVNSTTSLLYSSRTNQIGYVTSNSSTLGTIQVEINNEDINLSLTDIQRNILEGNVISGGIFQFPAPGITISSATTLNISAMKGWIVDNAGPTTSISPIATLIEYPGATGVTLSNITTATETYFLVNSSGVLTQQTTFPTPRQRRENIYLGKAGHANKSTIANAFPEPDIDVSPAAQVRDMFTPIKLINNGVYPSYVGANLTFQTSAGSLWGLGIGYTRDVLNPSSIDIPATSPTTFQYRTKAGGTYSNTTLIDPGFWDNAGVRTAVGTPTKQATNQRIFLIQNGIFRVQYGQTVYSDLTTALANVQNEIFDTFVNFRDNGILIGILSVVSNATNLSDPLQAKFLLVSKFGETVGAAGGLSTTTLQQAYDNSGEPEIVTNSILDGITFRRGTAADTDNVFIVQNGSGTNSFYVRGDGNTWMSNLHLNNIGLTSGASKYMVVNDSGDVFYQTTIVGGGGGTGPQGPVGGTGAGGALGYYGSFYDTTNQLNPTASTAMVMTINSTYESNGVSIVDGSKMTFAYSGTYNIQFSTVFVKTNSSAGSVDIWFAKNGQYITASNTEFNAAGQASSIASWNFMLTLNANDYIQLYWSSPATDIAITATGTQSNPLRPSVPSIILTAQQVMYTQLGPTGSTGFQGETGPQGYHGNTGPQGDIGFQGETGPQGYQGSQGSQGVQGETGTQGSQGPQGDQGFKGETGTQGSQGPQGVQGETGPQGLKGDPGPNVFAGVLYTTNTWSNPGNGSIVLPNVTVALYDNSNFNGLVSTYSVTGGTYTLANEDTNFIYIDYNSGNPIYGVDQSGNTINDSNVVRVMTVYRLNNFIHTLDFAYQGSGLPNKINNRIIAVERFARESGLIIGLSGSSGIVELSSGVAWNGTNRQNLAYLNSFDDIFFKNYHVSGSWTVSTSSDYLNNTYYDNGTDIVSASASKYLVNWYFRGQEINDHLYEVYGTDQYDSVSEAQISIEPNLPELVTSHAFLVGRVIVQVGTYSGLAETSFTTTFQATNVQAHNDLTNIQGGSPGEYYHLSSNQYNNIVIADGSQSVGDSVVWNGFNWESTTSVGVTGPQGFTGPQGLVGETGPQGNTGPQGEDGPQGLLGSTGVQGNTGPQGFQGSNFGFFFTASAPSTTGLTAGSRWLDSSTGVEFILVDDGDSIQWVEPLSTSSGSSGGGAGSQGPQGIGGSTGSQGNTGPQGDIGPQGAAGSGSSNYTRILSGLDPDVISGMTSSGTYRINGPVYDGYRINANINVPGGTNVYINYIGTVTITGATFTPHLTRGIVIADDPGGFFKVQSSLTSGSLVYDETLGFAAPVDLMTVNYDNTTSSSNYDIFFISGNTNNFSCNVFVDYEFYVDKGDIISFSN